MHEDVFDLIHFSFPGEEGETAASGEKRAGALQNKGMGIGIFLEAFEVGQVGRSIAALQD